MLYYEFWGFWFFFFLNEIKLHIKWSCALVALTLIFSIKKSLFLVKTIPTFLVKVDLFMFERKTWMILLMWVFLKQLQCLEFVSNLRIILKIYILHVLFQSEGTSLTFGPFFAVPMNDFWNAGMSEGFTIQLRSCFTLLPPPSALSSACGPFDKFGGYIAAFFMI